MTQRKSKALPRLKAEMHQRSAASNEATTQLQCPWFDPVLRLLSVWRFNFSSIQPLPINIPAAASLLRAHPHQLHGNAVHKRTESNHFVLSARGAIFQKSRKYLKH